MSFLLLLGKCLVRFPGGVWLPFRDEEAGGEEEAVAPVPPPSPAFAPSVSSFPPSEESGDEVLTDGIFRLSVNQASISLRVSLVSVLRRLSSSSEGVVFFSKLSSSTTSCSGVFSLNFCRVKSGNGFHVLGRVSFSFTGGVRGGWGDVGVSSLESITMVVLAALLHVPPLLPPPSWNTMTWLFLELRWLYLVSLNHFLISPFVRLVSFINRAISASVTKWFFR